MGGRLFLALSVGALAIAAAGGCSGVSNEAEPEAGAGGDAGSSGSSGAGRGGGAAGTRAVTGGAGGTAGRGGTTGNGGRGGTAGASSAAGGSTPLGDSGEAGQGGEAGGDAGTGGGSPGGVLNPLCSRPTPAELPDVPMVRTNTRGRPLFDLWRDIACDDVPTPLCSEASGNECGGCLREPSGAEGVCTYADIDVSCDGEGEALSYNDGECWICSPVEAHARACCEGLAGFDCRAWPFPADGKPGTVCARHEDCEPGLVCGPGGTYAHGYGICQCPGAGVELPETCTF